MLWLDWHTLVLGTMLCEISTKFAKVQSVNQSPDDGLHFRISAPLPLKTNTTSLAVYSLATFCGYRIIAQCR